MPSHSAGLVKAVRYAISALMLAAVLGILSLQQSTQATQAAWSATTHRQPAGQRSVLVAERLTAPLRSGPLLPLLPGLPGLPTWSANVRANTDTTGNGQHEPGLAVSPTNPNMVVIANKDYRDLNIKRVWIEVSRDGGQTWPTQLHIAGAAGHRYRERPRGDGAGRRAHDGGNPGCARWQPAGGSAGIA